MKGPKLLKASKPNKHETELFLKDPINWINKAAKRISKKEHVDLYIVRRAIMSAIITGKRTYIAIPRGR